MNFPKEWRSDLTALPPALRAVLDAEIAAGNELVEVEHGFPAPPVGACFKLARPMTTRAADANDGLSGCAWPNWNRSTGLTDAKGHFFLVNPPGPEPVQKSMDEIRAEVNRASEPPRRRVADAVAAIREALLPSRSSLVARFEASMQLDYERWREGTSYDLAAVREAGPDDKEAIVDLIRRKGVRDWRDVEALAEADTPSARRTLVAALESEAVEIRVSVLRHAPHVVSPAKREEVLLGAIDVAAPFEGLSVTVEQIVEFHPPAVMQALLRACLHRDGAGAFHMAGLVLFLHGQATGPIDLSQRPFLLRFNTPEPVARRAVFVELCARIGVAPETYF